MKNKNIIYILCGLMIIIILTLILIGVINKGNKKIENPSNNPNDPIVERPKNPEDNVKLKYPDNITKTNYSMDEIVSKFRLDGFAFTSTDFVKLEEATDLNLLSLKAYTNDKKDNVTVNIVVSDLASISNVIKDIYSDYKVISKNETEAKLIKEDNYFVNYVYIEIKFNSIIRSSSKISKSSNNMNNDTVFELIKKANETLTVDDSLPYLFDMATFLQLPFDQEVFYSRIRKVYSNGLQILAEVSENDNVENYYVDIYYDQKPNVSLNNVSGNPKIDTFEYKDEFAINRKFFRLYDTNKTYDIKISKEININTSVDVKDTSDFLKVIYLINDKYVTD